MIDLNFLRNNTEQTIQLIKRKDPTFDTQKLYDLDAQVRSLQSSVEELRRQKNELADRGRSGVTPELREHAIALSCTIKEQEAELEKAQHDFKNLYLSCPNMPEEDLPIGGKEANKVVTQWGKKPTFSFTPQHHVELGTALGWFDFAAAAKMTGSQFALYKNDAVRLMYALTRFMLEHNQKHGYQPILPPYLVNEQSLTVSGNFPKFRDQVYHVSDDNLYLSPTSEVNLVNLYRDHIFSAEELPVRLTAWTSCFRREAGAYGSTERGLIRIHQFEKVELVTFCTPENAHAELERMVTCSQEILQQLGLPYRISLLATQDCSFQSARTYDIEVWMAGQGAFYEVSSCSNCTTFQARRGAIRYRPEPQGKTELVYTLNGSSLALPRLVVALMEHYQQADGSIAIPPILKQYGF